MKSFYARLFKESDISNDYINMLNYKNNIYSRHQNKNYNHKTCLEYLKQANNNKDRFLIYFEKDSNKFLGTTCAKNLGKNKYNLGIMLHFYFRNKGLGKQIWRESLNDLISIGAVEIFAGTKSNNKSMLSILELSMSKIDSRKTTENINFRLIIEK